MLSLLIFGVTFAAGTSFLIFAFRGLARAQRNIRAREDAGRVVVQSLRAPGHSEWKIGKPLAIFVAISALPFPTVSQTASQPAAPTSQPRPLALPAMVGPLSTAIPHTFNASPFGNLDVTWILSGFGYWQGHPSASDQAARADISNAQVFIQKTSGFLQYFLQAGAYNTPALGTPFLSTRNTVHDFFGPLPQAYLKLAPNGNLSLLVGKLPTLIGAEDTFTFENLNIERGLLWNQENAVNRGIQVNYTKGKLGASTVWNDGFYSNRYNWITGALTYTMNSANSLELVAAGNLGRTGYSSIATPLFQNNSAIYDLIYTHTVKRWLFGPYLQYTRVPQYAQIGVGRPTSTLGGAVLGDYNFTPRFTLAGRIEYLGSSGNTHDGTINLVYGPGSSASSFTLTPTYQNKAFFTRGELSFTQAWSARPGDAFGPHGTNSTQARGVIEAGFMF